MARFDPIKERETLLSNLGMRRELAMALMRTSQKAC